MSGLGLSIGSLFSGIGGLERAAFAILFVLSLTLLIYKVTTGHKRDRALILKLLASVAPSPIYGLDLIKLSGGRLSGTVYVTLSRMEEEGLIHSEEIEMRGQALPRRCYRIADDAFEKVELGGEDQ